MGLFDKKFCDICGEKIGLLGNKKLEDGNMCKKCASLLSPWFSDRRHSTLAEIKDQLAYREANRSAVASFNVTRTLGRNTQVLLDEDAHKFMVAATGNLKDENPDVLDFSQVTGCNLDVNENRMEVKRDGPDGQQVSYNPPRYRYSYDFFMIINVNSPWFDEIRFKLNRNSVEIYDVSNGFNASSNVEYREYAELGREIKNALTQIRQDIRDSAAAAAAPKTSVICPNCGATTIPDANGRCEFCGGAVK